MLQFHDFNTLKVYSWILQKPLGLKRTRFIYFLFFSFLLSSDEYPRQSSCLDSHVTSCLQGSPYIAFQSEIVKLPKLLLYHCGSFGYEPSSISPIVLNLVDCNGAKLNEIVTCWDEFRSAFDANRNDSSLCR